MRSAKIVPILHEPETLKVGSYVRINNIDDDMYNKKYTVWTADAVVETVDSSFDVSTLSDS